MTNAYDRAALRHFDDAEHLAAASRFDNAGHLIGFAAECAIKHVLRCELGFGSSADLPDDLRHHLPRLANIARIAVRGRRKLPLAALLQQCGDSYFMEWKISLRYSNNGAVCKQHYQDWRRLAERTLAAAGLRRNG